MKIFEDEILEKNTIVSPQNKSFSPQSGNNFDIFDPAILSPEMQKYRAEYIKRITAKISAELDASLLGEEAPDGEEPTGELITFGVDPEKHFKLILKYLRGPRGFNGSADNLVVLSEAEYSRIKIKDPNKFYFTYEGDISNDYISGMVLFTESNVEQKIFLTDNNITNKILNI